MEYAYPQGNSMSGGNSGGMTLRDAFAIQAFGAVVGTATGLGDCTKDERRQMWEQLAGLIYEGADYMIAARQALALARPSMEGEG